MPYDVEIPKFPIIDIAHPVLASFVMSDDRLSRKLRWIGHLGEIGVNPDKFVLLDGLFILK